LHKFSKSENKTMNNDIKIPDEAKPFLLWDRCGQMTCRQVAIYLAIKANPDLSIGPLAESLGIFKPSVTRAVNKLHDMGLVRRVTDPYDRRKVKLTAWVSHKKMQSVGG
jgi:DNA-binding MarR family transcriptional regulator